MIVNLSDLTRRLQRINERKVNFGTYGMNYYYEKYPMRNTKNGLLCALAHIYDNLDHNIDVESGPALAEWLSKLFIKKYNIKINKNVSINSPRLIAKSFDNALQKSVEENINSENLIINALSLNEKYLKSINYTKDDINFVYKMQMESLCSNGNCDMEQHLIGVWLGECINYGIK